MKSKWLVSGRFFGNKWLTPLVTYLPSAAGVSTKKANCPSKGTLGSSWHNTFRVNLLLRNMVAGARTRRMQMHPLQWTARYYEGPREIRYDSISDCRHESFLLEIRRRTTQHDLLRRGKRKDRYDVSTLNVPWPDIRYWRRHKSRDIA